MADDPKQSHASPPFAYKGAARPLARQRPSESEASTESEDKRPTGLHTRPDLFGSSAVMARPVDLAIEDSEGIDPQESGDTASQADAEPRRDPAGTAGVSVAAVLGSSVEVPAGSVNTLSQPDQTADQTAEAPRGAGRSEARPGAAMPAANLLDHPVRIPESISFADWPNGPETEDGARSPDVTAPETGEPEASEPETPEPQDPPISEPVQEPVAARSEETPGRLEGLLARFDADAMTRRIRKHRWPLALGAVSCAALLVAGLVGGVVPFSGNDRGASQVAQGAGAPASEDLAGLSGTDQRDMAVAPAGTDLASDSPLEPLSDTIGAEIGAETGEGPQTSSQLAALPDSGAPGALEGDREPIVDFMRIDPDGKAVVAGRAAPGTELIILDNGEPMGEITADIYGLWTFVSQGPLASGRHEIGLRVKRQGSEISDPALVTDSGGAMPLAPDAPLASEAPVASESTAEAKDPLADETGVQDLPATEQLAAVAPETPMQSPVQTDASPPPAVSDEMSSAAQDQFNESQAAESLSAPSEPQAAAQTVEAAPVVADSIAPAEEAATDSAPAIAAPAQTEDQPLADAQQPAGDTLPAAEAEVVAATPAPAPKPEPPEPVQTAAAVPAGGDFVIQFASFKNPDTAVREQALVEQRFSDLLTGVELFVQQVDLAEQGTFYRVRLGPFASLADARATCTRFQERDRDCLAMAR